MVRMWPRITTSISTVPWVLSNVSCHPCSIMFSLTAYIIISNLNWPQHHHLESPQSQPPLKLPSYKLSYRALHFDEKIHPFSLTQRLSFHNWPTPNAELHAFLRHSCSLWLKLEQGKITPCSSRWAHQQQDDYQRVVTLQLKRALQQCIAPACDTLHIQPQISTQVFSSVFTWEFLHPWIQNF